MLDSDRRTPVHIACRLAAPLNVITALIQLSDPTRTDAQAVAEASPPGDGDSSPPGDGDSSPPGDGDNSPPGDADNSPPGDTTSPPGDGQPSSATAAALLLQRLDVDDNLPLHYAMRRLHHTEDEVRI